jgi:glycosyltransferase involved in cell wall biosynthesis
MAATEHRPVSVLFVSTTLDTGGAQRFTSTLLGHLDRQRFRPALCLLRREIGYPLPEDVGLHCFGYHRPWHIPSTVRRLRRLIEASRPDLVLSNIAATNLVTGMALRRCAHQPAWIARIGNDPSRHDRPIRSSLARRLYPRVDRFVVSSAGLRQGVVDFYPFTSERIAVLPTPTDFEAMDRQADEEPEYRHSGDGPLLIAVGRLFRQKRYDVMLEAISLVRRDHPVTLWICGDGPLGGALMAQIRRLEIADSVRRLGFCRNPFALMRQADLFVMSSDHEGLPNALIEAQGLGLPAVSTRCPYGPSEIVGDGETGLLVPVNDPPALGDALQELLADPARCRQMGAAARARVRSTFDAASIIPAWEELLLREVCRPE